MNNQITIDNCLITLTNPQKILFPRDGITKRELIDYYACIAPRMVPLIEHRPLALLRFPNGVDGPKFFQKKIPPFFPSWIDRVKVIHRSKNKNPYDYYVVCNNAAALVYLANYVCVPHLWLSKDKKLDYPDRLIFDLDPFDDTQFALVRTVALSFKELLTNLGMHPFVMTTGSRGLHVVVPIKPTHTFDVTRLFARSLAEFVAAKNKKLLTIQASKQVRGNRLFIDYLRNGYGATSVAPYAVRDKHGAPIAMPIAWSEVEDNTLISQRYTMQNVAQALHDRRDPWHNFKKKSVSLERVFKKVKFRI